MATSHLQLVSHRRTTALGRRLTHNSSAREKIFEHLLLAQLGMELTARGTDYEVLHAEVDRHGHDLVLDTGNVMRHVQLKVSILNGSRTEVTASVKLARKPSGCIIWLTFDPDTRTFASIRWFGDRPGKKLPDLGTRIARHSRGNKDGIKAERPDHRVVPASRFESIENIAAVADRLFGLPEENQLEFLLARLVDAPVGAPAWLSAMSSGDMQAIPAGVSWHDGGAEMGGLLDGYSLLAISGEERPDDFLDRQRETQFSTGVWPGSALTLWITLFLETRADRFGGIVCAVREKALDQLCQQLRRSLIELDTNDV